MADLSCKYLGLDLRNPLIVGNVENSSDINCLKAYEQIGAAAIILRPLFEENILNGSGEIRLEEGELIGVTDEAKGYLDLIKLAKTELEIPLIASINCITCENWLGFLPYIQEAGADALELNIFMCPEDKDFRSDDYENVFLDIVTKATYDIDIPVSLKIGPYFTNLVNIIDQVFYRGIRGVELFNRHYYPVIDLDELEIKAASLLGVVSDFNHTLHWTAIISSRINKLDILASANVHDGNSVIKLLLSGANAVTLYPSEEYNIQKVLPELINGVSAWMDEKGFEKIEHIQGQVNYEHIKDTSQYIRSEMLRIHS
jgi:dihydroorotate dehydrogenase (fumarate)